MEPVLLKPGSRVEIEDYGEGTIVDLIGDEVEIAVSELETVRVRADQVNSLQ